MTPLEEMVVCEIRDRIYDIIGLLAYVTEEEEVEQEKEEKYITDALIHARKAWKWLDRMQATAV